MQAKTGPDLDKGVNVEQVVDPGLQERAPADLTIVDVRPSWGAEGNLIDVEVDVRDDSSSTAPGESFNQGYVIVEGLGEFVTWSCFVIQPGQVITVDDSTITGTLDGEFTMPTSDVDLLVRAGGFAETNDCVQAATVGTETDRLNHTVQEFNPDDVQIEFCSPPDPSVVTPDEEVTLSVTLANLNDEDVEVDIVYILAQTGDILKRDPNIFVGGFVTDQTETTTVIPENTVSGVEGSFTVQAHIASVTNLARGTGAGAGATQTAKGGAVERQGMSTQGQRMTEAAPAPQAVDCGSLTIEPAFDTTNVFAVAGTCSLSPTTVQVDGTVTCTVDVRNDNDVAASVDVHWFDFDTGEILKQAPNVNVPANSVITHTVDVVPANTNFSIGDHLNMAADVRDVQQASTLGAMLGGSTLGVDRTTLATAGAGILGGVAALTVL